MTEKSEELKKNEDAPDSEPELVLKHGLLLHDTYKFSSKILSLIYDSGKDSFVVLLQGAITVYQYGLKKRVINEGVDYFNLLYASEHDRYVGVSEHRLYLLEEDLSTVLHESPSDHPISCCLYNSFNDTIITAGNGYINVWRFHRGGKTLLLDQVIKNGLNGESVFLLHTEEVPGNAQRLFAVIGNGIKVFLLASSRLISEGKSLHSRPISAVLFFRPLTYLITGARDGSIKVWNKSWTLQYSFISHQSPVTAIMPYPIGPCIITGSLDGTLVLWNLFHWDKIQVIDHALPVKGLYSEPGHMMVVSHSCRQVKTWDISELYERTTIIRSDAVKLSPSSHPLTPLRLTGIFNDSTIRIISPVGGAIVTAVLLPPKTNIISAVHMPHHEWLFLLTGNGLLSKYDTSTNPSRSIPEWTHTLDTGKFTCLALYQQIMDTEEIDDLVKSDQWLPVIIEAHEMRRGFGGQQHPLKKIREGVHLIIAGTETGYLCVLNKETGVTQCVVKSYDTPVTNIIPHPKQDQLLSITTDACIKVWRVYCYTQDCLELLMSFSVLGVPSHVCVLVDRICVTVNSEDRASYANTIYSMTDQTMFSSDPHNDHTETITALDVCTPMHLFVTSSRDCSIRLWSQDNRIVRILQLDALPTSVVFSSPFGGLTVSLRSHLHTISHSTHLVGDYIKQLVTLGVREDSLKGELPRELYKSLEEFDEEDQIRLEPIDDHIEVTSYRGALSEEELNILDRIREAKRQGIEKLLDQDKELKCIRDGTLTTEKQKPQALSKALKSKAWKEVYSMIRVTHPHGIPVIPELDDFDPDTYGMDVITPEPYEPFKVGDKAVFFPPLSKFLPPYPIAPDGFLPNSAVVQKLRKSDEDKRLAKQWQPPVLNERQKRMMREKKEEPEEELDETANSEVMERIRAAMMAQQTPDPTPTPTPPPTPPPPRPTKELKSQMKVEKLVAPKPKPKPPPPPKPRTPTPPPPPRSPTPPPPPPTPLPDYIAQFIGQPWFESLYPNATSKTFPKPWTVTRFIYALISWFQKPMDPSIKGDICAALLSLIKEFKPKNMDEVRTSVISLLTGPPPVSTKDILDRYLVSRGLELLIHINELDYSFMSLLMSYFTEGNQDIIRLVKDYFKSRSVIDPYNYFTREMDTNLASSGSQLSDLITRSTGWLETWSIDYLKSKGVKIPVRKKSTATRSSRTGSKSQPELQLPYCDPIDVVKYFIKTEHERELARRKPATPPPPPPPPPDVDALHDVVVPLPVLDHTHNGLVRLGETHCSKCHPERETSLAHVTHLVKVQRGVASSDSLRAINLSLSTQNINPFLTPEERQERKLMEQSRNRLISNTRLFLLEHSYPQ